MSFAFNTSSETLVSTCILLSFTVCFEGDISQRDDSWVVFGISRTHVLMLIHVTGAPQPVPMFSPGVKVAPSRRGTNKKSGRGNTAHGRRRVDDHVSGSGSGDGGGKGDGGGDGEGGSRGEGGGVSGSGGVAGGSDHVDAPPSRVAAPSAKPPTSPRTATTAGGESGSDDVPSMAAPTAQQNVRVDTPPNSRAQQQQKSEATANRAPTFANSPYFKRDVKVAVTRDEKIKATAVPPDQHDDNEDEWETDEHTDHDAHDDAHAESSSSGGATTTRGTCPPFSFSTRLRDLTL